MRAYRRHKRQVALKKATKIAMGWWGIKDPNNEDVKQKALRIYKNRKPCSCDMCGNPRKYWNELTIQERRWQQ